MCLQWLRPVAQARREVLECASQPVSHCQRERRKFKAFLSSLLEWMGGHDQAPTWGQHAEIRGRGALNPTPWPALDPSLGGPCQGYLLLFPVPALGHHAEGGEEGLNRPPNIEGTPVGVCLVGEGMGQPLPGFCPTAP